MNQKRTTVFVDLLFCVVILPLIIMLLPVDKWIVRHPIFATTMVTYLYALYYAIRRIHIPALIIARRYGSIVCFAAVVMGLAWLLSHFPFESPPKYLPLESRIQQRVQAVWLLTLVVVGFGLSIELMLELFRQILLRKDMETEKQKAELALYKTQINPHFLFNTLNSIYGLVISKSDRAEQAFAKFTGILQYMYSHATDDTISISEEVGYISAYIDLQSLRLNHHTKVVWESSIDDGTVQIPPMILITFVENAFKFGTSPQHDCEIAIRVSLCNGLLRFESVNDVMRVRGNGRTFVGIENCRLRLELLYPQRFTLSTTEEAGKFKVIMTIQLQ
ncbi:MAG: histidine kinase [Prevotella sp.]|nr:histidine kinase [Prevotella sp.]